MNFGFIGDIFFPPQCAGCGSAIKRGAICEECFRRISLFHSLFCSTCGARFPALKKVCHQKSEYLQRAAGSYDDDTLRNLIHALKFQYIEEAALPLAAILFKYIKALPLDLRGYTVTPLPLSKQRERARGFNQAALIARSFAARLKLPFSEDIITRIEHRKPQSSTGDILERIENVRGCFSLKDAAAADNKNIVLVDDVITSGTTFREAAHVLKLGGAKKIIALAVAKA